MSPLNWQIFKNIVGNYDLDEESKQEEQTGTFPHPGDGGPGVDGVAQLVDHVAQRVRVRQDLVGQAVVVLPSVGLLVWKVTMSVFVNSDSKWCSSDLQ